jgi:hypothetical protein
MIFLSLRFKKNKKDNHAQIYIVNRAALQLWLLRWNRILARCRTGKEEGKSEKEKREKRNLVDDDEFCHKG